MSIITENTFHALGSVAGTTGLKVSGAGFEPSQTGIGVYTLVFEEAIDEEELAFVAACRSGATPRFATHEVTGDTTIVVRTWDAAGNAGNSNFDFILTRAPSGIGANA